MASSCVFRRLCSTTAAAPVKRTRWERLRDSKTGVWFKGLMSDYKEACREIVTGAWEHPIKASVYAFLLGGAWAASYTNPDEDSFLEAVLDTSNRLALLSPWTRSGMSDAHVQNLVSLRNEGRLRYLGLGVASVVYRVDHHPAVGLYEAQCSHLSPPWRELPRRVLDVGVARHWWVLEARMREYDVNEEAFGSLPDALRLTAPPSAEGTLRNEELHRASWRALEVEEEPGTGEKRA